MEFVDGGALHNWASVSRRSWQQVVEILWGVADGLGCAHEAGVLHGNIKPSNILVTKSGHAKLADFGRPNMVVGNAAYVSPEQIADQPLDARSDVYSFGVVLHQLLTEVPSGLRLVVEKALEKDPGNRYQSMQEMVVDLRRLTQQESTGRKGYFFQFLFRKTARTRPDTEK